MYDSSRDSSSAHLKRTLYHFESPRLLWRPFRLSQAAMA